ncbi:MAG: ferrous iron transport protein A [Candidatus Omnitrophica bacterium]|nr:ferrous iron transport protein A [Candidatus Omnitrophota bacterium]
MDNKKTLRELGPGASGRIVRVSANAALKKRLLDMGVVPGVTVEVVKVAPLGDPVDIKVKGYHLSLRRDEAGCIEVNGVS